MTFSEEEFNEIDAILKEFPGVGERCEYLFSFLLMVVNLGHLLIAFRFLCFSNRWRSLGVAQLEVNLFDSIILC